ncbi:uncharacterized protein [Heptranchias perlo]|uniref:uncharacterized protein n=1 Tax=Heptranchias perlo TaxID=212740 RepID=UPI00355AA063
MRKFLERKVDELREEMRNEVRGSEMEMDRATEELEKCLRNELEEFCGNYDLNFKECAMKTPVNSVRKRLQGTAGDLVEETWRELIPSNEERDSVPRELDRDLRREPEGFRENDRPGSKTFSRRFLVGMSIGALIVGFVLGVVLWATVPNPRFACSNPTGVRKENVTAYPSGNAPPGGGAGVRDWDGVDVPPTIPLIETPNRAKRSQDHEAPPGGRAGVRPGSKTYSRRFLVGMPIGALIVGFVLGVVLWATAPNPRFACSNPTGASLDTGLGLEWVGVGKEKATSHPSGNAPPGGGAGVRDWDGVDVPPTIPPIQTQNRAKRSQDHEAPPGGGAGVRDWDGVDVPPTIPPIQTQNRAKRSQDHEAPPGGGAGVRDWDGVDVPPDHPPDTDTEPC